VWESLKLNVGGGDNREIPRNTVQIECSLHEFQENDPPPLRAYATFNSALIKKNV
jgi:hypothetical protein